MTASRNPRVAVFSPNPLLTVTLETRDGERDEVHVHPGGQGVWVAHMAAELGAQPILCGFVGGESGAVLDSLLPPAVDRRFVFTAAANGSYVTDRRHGTRELLGQQLAQPPSRHELDDLVSITCATALDCEVLVMCNPFPAEILPLEIYGSIVANVRENGTPVLVDLSSPRLDSALGGHPDLVKLNDWELAEFVAGPVDGPRLRAAAELLRDRGASTVVVTRGGDPAFVLCGNEFFELVPPRFGQGSREGCGDSMMGGIAAGWAMGMRWQDALALGAAAGAANFLRHGLGTGSRATVEELRARVSMRPIPSSVEVA